MILHVYNAPSNVQSPCSSINCQGHLLVVLLNKVTFKIKETKTKSAMLFASTKTAVQASSEKDGIQKLSMGLRTENASFPQVVDTLFVDWLVAFAALSNSFDAKLLQQVVKHPMKAAKGVLARTKLR